MCYFAKNLPLGWSSALPRRNLGTRKKSCFPFKVSQKIHIAIPFFVFFWGGQCCMQAAWNEESVQA